MKRALWTAWAVLAASSAFAEGLPQTLGSDPLTKQILMKAVQFNGGVTAAARLGTGQTIELRLPDISSAPFATPLMAPAAAASSLKLAPAAGLAARAKKSKVKTPVGASAQLKHVSSKVGKDWGEAR